MIIDVKEIDKYPNGGCLMAEIKESRFEGVGFFWGNTDIYLTKNKKFSKSKRHNKLYYNAFDIGVIPYEWIESIELNGDDYNSCPQIYCHFKKRNSIFKIKSKHILEPKLWKYMFDIRLLDKTPFKEIIYFDKNKSYQEDKNRYWEEYIELFNKKQMKKLPEKNTYINA